MDNERKNIDELFKKHLLNHEVIAPEDAWAGISSRVARKPVRKAIYYVRLAAASVLILFAFGLGYYYALYQNDVITSKPVASSQQNKNKVGENLNQVEPSVTKSPGNLEENINSGITKEPVDTSHKSKKTSKTFNETTSTNPISESVAVTTSGDQEPGNNPDNVAPADQIAVNQTQTEDQDLTQAPIGIPKEIPPGNTPKMSDEMLRKMLGINDNYENDEIKVPAPTKWSVGGQLAPMYSYRMIEVVKIPEGTELNEDFYNSVEDGIATISTGLNVNYAFNENLALQTGFYFSKIGQSNSDVPIFNEPNSQYLMQMNSSAGNIIINPSKFESQIDIEPANPKDSTTGSYAVNSTLYQNFSYIEIPLVMKYNLIDRKVGLNLRGGLSPGIMVGNNSYFAEEGDKISSGITQDVNQVIYNGLVGFGVDFKLSKTLIFNLEPTLKYSLFSITSGEFVKMHPYSISCFTGISYKF